MYAGSTIVKIIITRNRNPKSNKTKNGNSIFINLLT